MIREIPADRDGTSVPRPKNHANPIRILVVDDDEQMCQKLRELLREELALHADICTNPQQALEALQLAPYSVLLMDLDMLHQDVKLMDEIHKRRLPVRVIVTICEGNIEQAVQAIRSGAHDCVCKPVDGHFLSQAVTRALREPALQAEVTELRKRLQTRYSFQSILSKNARMHAIFELVQHVAQTTSTVLIQGETGTGKEQVARAVHTAAQHRKGPFIAINCAAVPETLLESELFGHEKGAFTSAVGQRTGRFEMADGGTIFLDEIGDVPAAMQAKLLRVLQERCFERVGGTQTIHVDVRVIAASNRCLQQLVREGKLREDLFYRLNVVKIELPPLRERSEDIPLLAAHFTQKYARPGTTPKEITPAVMEVLVRHSWPGNIRELENVIERGCVTSRGPLIEMENLPPELLGSPRPSASFSINLGRPLGEHIDEAIKQIERDYLQKALQETQGHIGHCSRLCGLSRRSVTLKMAEYALEKSAFKKNPRLNEVSV